MKIWTSPLLAIIFALLCGSPVNAESTDKSEFNRIYREYKEIADGHDYERQLQLLEQSLELGKKIFDSPSKSLAGLYHSVANLRYKNAQDKKALTAFYSALRQYELLYGRRSEELVSFLLDFGDYSIDPGGIRPNQGYYKSALNIIREKYGERSPEYSKLLIEVGNRKLLNIHSSPYFRVFQANKDITMGHQLMSEITSPQDERMLYANMSLAKLKLNLGHKEEALDLLNSSLKLADEHQGKDSESSLTIHGFLANTYSSLGQPDQATEHCRAISSLSSNEDRKHPKPVVLFNSAKTDWSKEATYPPFGYVDLIFDVDESGFVDNIKVENYKGLDGYVEEAKRLAKKFRYAPAIIDGEFVISKNIRYRMEFKSSLIRACINSVGYYCF